MSRELCPSCRELRKMDESVHTTTENDSDGSPQKVTVHTYHCATCHSFVRSHKEGPGAVALKTEVVCPGCNTRFPITPEVWGVVAQCSECELEFEIKTPSAKQKKSEQKT